jgi:hypothetical protein
MEPRKPFIPASARHDRVGQPPRVLVNKAVRDLVASGITAEEADKHDGKQGALDGIPNLVLGGPIGRFGVEDGEGGGPPKKDTTEKSTGKEEGKEGKEGKESKDGDEKGKDSKDKDESGKIGSGSEVEFGFVRYGRPETLQVQQLAAAVMAHGARGLAKGPMV